MLARELYMFVCNLSLCRFLSHQDVLIHPLAPGLLFRLSIRLLSPFTEYILKSLHHILLLLSRKTESTKHTRIAPPARVCPTPLNKPL